MVTAPPNSPHVAPSNLQPISDGKDSSSNEKLEEQGNDRPRIRASKVDYKTVNEVYVDESIS